MAAFKELPYSDIGFPDHFKHISDFSSELDVQLFDLSSHAKAKEAIEFGLKLRQEGFHIYVIGEESSGRISATMDLLRSYSRRFPPPLDWAYLPNFKAPQKPIAFSMGLGLGQKLKGHMTAMLPSIQLSLLRHLENEETNINVQKSTRSLEDDISEKIEDLRLKARQQGFDITRNQTGQLFIVPLSVSGKEGQDNKIDGRGTPSVPEVTSHLPEKEGSPSQKSTPSQHTEQLRLVRELQDGLTKIGQDAHQAEEALIAHLRKERRHHAQSVIEPFCRDLAHKFPSVPHFGQWMEALQEDLLQNFELFFQKNERGRPVMAEALTQRYSVNVLVDHSHYPHAPIITVTNPTYENLFGSIKYQTGPDGGFETNLSLIQPGALHQANGGLLVIYAEALAQQQDVWEFLKQAMRDREIKIEEIHRQHGVPLLLAPKPQPIPMDVQIVLIGAPWWFDDFYSTDPEFRSYFKIRAEIQLTLEANDQNILTYGQLIHQWATRHLSIPCDATAIHEILGHSSRWANHRQKLSARFELAIDLLREAKIFAEERDAAAISREDVESAFRGRRERKRGHFFQMIEETLHHRTIVHTEGAVIGQVNALTVLTSFDNTYGFPARVTARTYAAKDGIVSIERSIEMSGAIQNKGIMILSGFLNGLLGQEHPLSFGCSLTFEQMYVPIDGDSASVAELLAVLSALAHVPIQQNIAITGSVDHWGYLQAVGGVHQKIEGFYELCKARGFTGQQGVLVPESNCFDLVMTDEIVHSVQKGEFHIWSARHIEDVTPLLLNMPLHPASKKRKKEERSDSIIDRIKKRLCEYSKLLRSEE